MGGRAGPCLSLHPRQRHVQCASVAGLHRIAYLEWGESDNKRKAKYYTFTAAGRRRFQEQTQNWEQMADIIATVLKASPDEL